MGWFHVPQTSDQWGDAISLGMLALMWWVMLWYELRRTWRWDPLGRTLTAKTFVLGVTATLATAQIVVAEELWTPPVRWTLRAVLFAVGLAVIVILKFDEPPQRKDKP